jgi:uncharacterized protein (DUF1330 family)
MAAYFIASYDIHDHDTFAKYNPGGIETIMATLTRHGGKLLCVGINPEWLGSDRRDTLVVLEFPDREAALAWHEDPDYLPVRAHRLASTNNVLACVLDGPPAPE